MIEAIGSRMPPEVLGNSDEQEDGRTSVMIRYLSQVIDFMSRDETAGKKPCFEEKEKEEITPQMKEIKSAKYEILLTNGTNNQLSLGQYSEGMLKISDAPLLAQLAHFSDSCEDCQCLNAESATPNTLVLPLLRLQTWSTILLTISGVGIVCSLAFALHLSCKSCAEVVDGSQSLSIFLLFLLVLIYSSLSPFAFYPDKLVCMVRLHGPSIAYSLLFSLILSRSLMLATADFDGLPGHVSGLLQAFIFMTLSGLQMALVAQEYLIRETPYTTTTLIGMYQETRCSDVGRVFVYHLCYPMVLLGLQVIVSPFIVRSRRNYREGLLFCVASVVCLLVWLGWCSFYLLVAVNIAQQWMDFAVCVGLLATATTVLIIVYVPKVKADWARHF